MIWGIVTLFCPICRTTIEYAGGCWKGLAHHEEFGVVCSRECLDLAERKYASMILGKDNRERIDRCFLCNKVKGQPPERCPGHYETSACKESIVH